MRNVVLIIFLMVVISCDDRAAGLRTLNDPPSIQLRAEKGVMPSKYLIDSVKSSNPAFSFMPFIIQVKDPNENIKRVTYQTLRGRGSLIFRGEKLVGDTVRIMGDSAIYRYVPDVAGTVIIQFIARDIFNVSDSATMQLHVFKNLPPIAIFASLLPGNRDKYEVMIDASASYDQDQSYGGVVTKYNFWVGNKKVAETTSPVIYHIFPAPGNYTVRLQVQDNDGDLSKEAVTTVTVN